MGGIVALEKGNVQALYVPLGPSPPSQLRVILFYVLSEDDVQSPVQEEDHTKQAPRRARKHALHALGEGPGGAVVDVGGGLLPYSVPSLSIQLSMHCP